MIQKDDEYMKQAIEDLEQFEESRKKQILEHLKKVRQLTLRRFIKIYMDSLDLHEDKDGEPDSARISTKKVRNYLKSQWLMDASRMTARDYSKAIEAMRMVVEFHDDLFTEVQNLAPKAELKRLEALKKTA